MTPHTLLVVGGNGFLGSAVCRAAISRGWNVHSLSTSGRPPSSPGTEPAPWTSKVIYHQGSAFDPSTYSHLLASSTAVVHTLGILLESDYKGAVRSGSAGGVLSSLMAAGRFLGSNPLEKRRESSDRMSIKPTYESMNRDSAISVFESLKSTPSAVPDAEPATPFVYISAEDIFQPFVPARYISTKREAEAHILQPASGGSRKIRSLVLRPGIMTHPTERPFLSPLSPLLALSSSLPPILPNLIRSVPHRSNGPVNSLAHFLETKTLDVDDVGEAVCVGIEGGTEGVLGVREIAALTRKR